MPVVLAGGVSRNRAMVRHLREVLRLGEAALLVPQLAPWCGAIGAVCRRLQEARLTPWPGLDAIRNCLVAHAIRPAGHHAYPPLSAAVREPAAAPVQAPPAAAATEAFLGIDIGSISTNLVLLAPDGTLLAKQYLMTAGRPIEAVNRGLGAFREQFGSSLKVLGCGTTGSGRYLIGDMFGADLVKNEITAQARGAVFLVPSAETVFEIGGQDSKYISIKNGLVSDFTMNKACAAGTGSFLEEQAGLMGISVKDEFSALAFRATQPTPLGQRCTVFIESDLVRRLGEGETRGNLCAGLAYSIVHNYINRVVENRPLGKTILFQGGTAFNKAVAAAFSLVTGREVIVPPHNEVTGALGMAVIVRDAWRKNPFPTGFRGLERLRSATLSSPLPAVNAPTPARSGAWNGRGRRRRFFTDIAAKNTIRLRPWTTNGLIFPWFATGCSTRRSPRGRAAKSGAGGAAPGSLLPRDTAVLDSLLGGPRLPAGGLHGNQPQTDQGRDVPHPCGHLFPHEGLPRPHRRAAGQRCRFLFYPGTGQHGIAGFTVGTQFQLSTLAVGPFLVRAAFRDRQPRIFAPSLLMQYGPGPVLRELAPMAGSSGYPAGTPAGTLPGPGSAAGVRTRCQDAARTFLVVPAV
jgi:predicted CoA-substrate-specific enzyme activase